MTRTRIVWLLTTAVAVPMAAVAALSVFAAPAKPCLVAGAHAYRISGNSDANVTVRVSQSAAHANLRLQLVNDPAMADFVLVDDDDGGAACRGASSIKSIRLDNTAARPDLTVALSQKAAPFKIYVHSAHYTPQDAAALFAVMRRDTRGPELAARD